MTGGAPVRGFVLTPVTRVVAGRPEVHLHVVCEDGRPGLVIDDRAIPHFFIRTADVARATAAVPRLAVTPTDLRSLGNEPVSRVEVALPQDVPPLRARLRECGVECLEADVRFAYRWLIDHGIRGALAIDGPVERRPGVGRVWRNPRVTPAAFVPRLRVLSFDIETSPDARRLYAVACAGVGGDRVLLVGADAVEGAEVVPDERTLLARLIAHVRRVDPDVLTGWNVCDFDLPVLLRACRQAGLRCALGRTDEEIDVRRDPGFSRESRVLLGGRVVLDGLALARSAFLRLDDYRVETAAQAILGRGKLLGPDAGATEIDTVYRTDPARLAAYNLEDARLVLDILARTGLVELTVRRSLATGMQLDRVGAQIAAVDSLYLGALRRRGRVAPSVGRTNERSGAVAGGLVLDSVPGLYRNICVYDFRSLYPSLIRTFNIDPLTHVPDATAAPDGIRTPGGAVFRRDEPGILPALVTRLATERTAARRAGDATGAQALKILMNSLFGVLGSPASRLCSPSVANAITTAGQHVIRLAAAAVRDTGHRVIYGDTDSLFVDLGEPDTARAMDRGRVLRETIGAAVGAAIEREFGCTSHLELEFEKVYARFFMPEVRGGAAGSKKRYAGLVAGDDGAIEIVGLEAARRDWSAVARRFQRELLDRVFHDRPVAAYVRETVAALRAGRLDDALVYRKAVRKPLAEYTRTTPPHVKAARRLRGAPGRLVSYVMTQAGPEPVGQTTAPPDHDHYLAQQLRPIAEAVLRFLPEPDFDTIIDARRQLSLFD